MATFFLCMLWRHMVEWRCNSIHS